MIVIEMRKQKFILFSFKLTSVNRRLFTISLPIARFSFMFLFLRHFLRRPDFQHSKALTCTLGLIIKEEKRKLAKNLNDSSNKKVKNFKLWGRHFSTSLECAYFNDSGNTDDIYFIFSALKGVEILKICPLTTVKINLSKKKSNFRLGNFLPFIFIPWLWAGFRIEFGIFVGGWPYT